MKGFVRQRVVAVGIAGAVGLSGLAGCGRLDRSPVTDGQAPASDSQVQTSDLGWDAQALQSMGMDPADLAPAGLTPVAGDAPSPTPGAKAGPSTGSTEGSAGTRRRHRLVRFAFGRSVLHGEAVVQTDDGTKTVVAQRGVVTAIDATSVTVKSTDGFTLTWIFGSPITVIERRSQVAPSAISVGTQVGVAGDKTGSAPSARLIVVPNKKS